MALEHHQNSQNLFAKTIIGSEANSYASYYEYEKSVNMSTFDKSFTNFMNLLLNGFELKMQLSFD